MILITLILLLTDLQVGEPAAATSCTDVHDVRVVIGDNALLYCKINNEPNTVTFYKKTWGILTPGNLQPAPLYTMISKTGAGFAGNNYTGRVEVEDKDNVRLKNVKQKDAGEYECSWDVSPSVPGCVHDKATFTMTVIVPVSSVSAQVASPKKEGESTTFLCTASGTPAITYSWQKVGGSLPGDGRWQDHRDGSATLNNIQRADDGKYTFTADNEAQRPQTSSKVRLEVYYAPSEVRLTSSPSGLTQQENTQISVTCTAAGGHPTADVIIYRGSSNAASVKPSVQLNTTLQKSDNQRAFVCRATSAGITGEMSSNQITYNVLFDPTGVAMTQSPDGAVDANTDVTLTCRTTTSSNPPVSLTWTRDGSTVSEGVTSRLENGDYNAKVSRSDLKLRAQKQHNGNIFTCRVATMTQLTAQKNLTVHFAPDQLSESESPARPVRAGTIKSLSCSTDSANPAPHVTWTRNDVTATDHVSSTTRNGQYKGFIVNSTITITTTRGHNENIYRCKVEHKNKDLPNLTKSFPLNITFPHNVSISASANPVVEGQSTTLTCDARGGNPHTVQSYVWTRSPAGQVVIGSARQLVFQYVTYMDAADYQCSVTNMGGTASKQQKLVVLYSAKADTGMNQTQNISAEYNQTVTFTLTVIANPHPNFTWWRLYNASKLPLLKKTVVKTAGLKSSLTIPDTAKQDMVSYRCDVTNAIGVAEFTFHLIPSAAPDIPTNTEVSYVTAVSFTLTWKSGFNGGFTQTFSVMYRKTSQTWPDNPQINRIPDPGENKVVVYKIGSLEPGTTYEFRVRAVNTRVRGENKSAYTTVISNSTLALPSVSGGEFRVTREPGSVTAYASWPEPRGHFTDISIKICEKPDVTNCRLHDVNLTVSVTSTTIHNLEAQKSYKFTLRLYDADDLVFRSADVTSRQSGRTSQVNPGAVAGGVVGSLLAILLISAVVTGILYKRKKDEAKNKNDKNINGNPRVLYQNNGLHDDLSVFSSGTIDAYENLRFMAGSGSPDATYSINGESEYQNVNVRPDTGAQYPMPLQVPENEYAQLQLNSGIPMSDDQHTYQQLNLNPDTREQGNAAAVSST